MGWRTRREGVATLVRSVWERVGVVAGGVVDNELELVADTYLEASCGLGGPVSVGVGGDPGSTDREPADLDCRRRPTSLRC